MKSRTASKVNTNKDMVPGEFVLVATEQSRPINAADVKKLVSALAEMPSDIKLKQVLRAQDRTKEIFVWQGTSIVKIKEYVSKAFTKGKFTVTIIGTITFPPNITGIFGNITQGGLVAVSGSNFGAYNAKKSHLRVIGSIPAGTFGALQISNTPNPTPAVNGFPAIELGINGSSAGHPQWTDNFVLGGLPLPPNPPWPFPSVLTGLDQPSSLEIVAANGLVSNAYPVEFRSQRAEVHVPNQAFRTVACGGGDNTCTSGDPNVPTSVTASHGTPGPGNLGGSGTDLYSCQLLNGFTYSRYEWAFQDGINGGPFGADPEPLGSASINLKVSWFYDVAGIAYYGLNVFAMGPINFLPF